IALGIAVLALHYLDLKRRTYSIYNGLVQYHEGFLTKKDAIIPVENISNSEVTRNIVDRLTDLYQVKVSCQGAGQEIRFRHLKHGEKFNSTLERLVDEQSGRSETSATPPDSGEARLQVFSFSRDTETTAKYGMHMWRTLMPLLLCYILLPVLVYIFPLLLLLIGYTVYELVRVRNTTYFLNKSSVQEKFEFFASKSREFSTDKITGVTFRENVLDRYFNTCSIKFWSIGAADDITFRNVPKSEDLQDTVLAKAGIDPGRTLYTFNSEFSLPGMIMANLPSVAVLILLFAAGPVLAALYQPAFAGISLFSILVFAVWYCYAFLYYPRSGVLLYDNSLEFRRGLIVESITHALYPNVKDISTTKYPFLDTGQMRFNIAGERIKKTQYGEVRTPNGFSVYYVPGILNKDDVFDQLLLGRTEQSLQTVRPLMTSGKVASNTVFVVVLASVLLFPLLALLPLSLGIAVWKARRVKYIIEPERVLMRKGVLYRRQTSIIFDRIDHIQTGQNFLNKLFKNGNILIYTAGSSKPELVLKDIRNHTEFHRQLRNYY
ncbi:MAG: PH domain-containing protein, partial [Thermodesulfobacteriota bacterium]